ncbi:MAG: apolipoprotein N-acyltransferase [Pseudomonadota bacterium]
MPLGVIGLPGFLALFWAVAFALAQKFRPDGILLRALSLAAWLILAELARGHVLTGFPWALLAYAWVETPFLQTASWAGPYGLSLIVLILTGLLLSALLERAWLPGAAVLLTIAALWAWGTARVPGEAVIAPDAPLIRIVQPNAPQHLKWDPAYAPRFYRRLLAHSRAPADSASGRPDLIVWPEMAVTFPPGEYPEALAQIAEAAAGAPVVLGALHRDEVSGEPAWLNAMMTVLPEGRLGPRYDKHHLVPFGEYMPFKEVISLIGLRQLAQHGGLSSGTGPEMMNLPGLPAFAATICYEMIFPHRIVPSGPRPSWILTITNDAWFGGFAGPQQHLAQARFRAVEQGLPVARAANTGISSVLDSYGRIQQQLALHRDGYFDQKLPSPAAATIYSFTGNFPALLACLMLIFVTIRNRSG